MKPINTNPRPAAGNLREKVGKMKYYIAEYEDGRAEIRDENLDFVKDCDSLNEALEWCGDDEYEIATPVAD